MNPEPLVVLLIEDDRVDARYIEVLLAESDTLRFELRHVERLAEGLKMLEQGGIDVVLLDLNLIETRGQDTLEAMQDAYALVPVVVMTTVGDEALSLEAMRRGAQDYLVKGEPDSESLITSLRYAIERFRAEQKVRESEARLRLLTTQVPAIMWTTDKELSFTSSLGRELDALDLQPDKVVGMSLSEYLAKSGPAEPLLAMHRDAVEGRETSANVEWAGRWFHSHVEPLLDARGQIAGTVGVALDITDQHHLERGLEAAQRIQQHLLPTTAPQRRGFDIAGACYPAEQCSGDYFDYIPMRDDNLAILLADAAGHGFGPAILAATVRSYLRAVAMQGKDVHEMLTYANWLLANDSEADQYVTMFCCQLDPHRKSFTYAAAGHQAYLIDADGMTQAIESNSMPLGVEESEVFQLSPTIAIRPGDMLLLLTDGVVEAEDKSGKRFGMRRTLRVLNDNRHKPARELIQAIYDAVVEHARPQSPKDDITAVIVKFNPDSDSA